MPKRQPEIYSCTVFWAFCSKSWRDGTFCDLVQGCEMYWSRAGSLVAVPSAAFLKAAILSMQLRMWECMYYTCLRLVCGKIIIAYEYCHCLLGDSKTVWQVQITHRSSLGKTLEKMIVNILSRIMEMLPLATSCFDVSAETKLCCWRLICTKAV